MDKSDSSQRVLVAIQARMGSTRLPAKVVAPILGKPMVWRIVERVGQSRTVDRVVLATTTESADDALVGLAEEWSIGCYRGSVDDLVERLLGAAEHFGADVLVRIWGDCPFADPEVIDRAVETLLSNDLDYVSNTVPGQRTYPGGLDVEVYRRSTLEAIRDSTEDGFYREFPLEYVTGHSDRFRWSVIRHEEDLSYVQLTVDYPEDLEVARLVYSALYRSDGPFSFREAVAIVQQDPGLGGASSRLPRNVEYLQKRRERQ